MKVYYDLLNREKNNVDWSNAAHFEFEDYIGTTAKTKQPTWFQELTQFVNNCKNKNEFLKEHFSWVLSAGPEANFKTAKSCPAFINLFKQSLALKTAADIYIKITRDASGDFSYFWNTRDDFWMIDSHSPLQSGSISERCVILKFNSAIFWAPSQDTQYQYLDAYMHNEIPYRVFPGSVVQKKNTVSSVNMPVMFPAKEAEYIIEAGTTLGYLYFDKPIKKVERKDMKEEYNRNQHKAYVKQDLKDLMSKK